MKDKYFIAGVVAIAALVIFSMYKAQQIAFNK